MQNVQIVTRQWICENDIEYTTKAYNDQTNKNCVLQWFHDMAEYLYVYKLSAYDTLMTDKDHKPSLWMLWSSYVYSIAQKSHQAHRPVQAEQYSLLI